MATAEQLKGLIKSFAEGDDDRFLAISMQMASHAARKGQTKLADELRKFIDQAKVRQQSAPARQPVPIVRARGELAGLLSVGYPKLRLSDMVFAAEPKAQLARIVLEYRQQHRLRARNLSARRKLLLVGPPGSGKTMTASALAGELALPLLVVQLHGLITKFMGETAAKLRLIFDAMDQTRGVYLFDEFDAIGGNRDLPNDVGEIRRVLNSFLQFLEQDQSDSFVIAATNHAAMLDRALYRRFDDCIKYCHPTQKLARELISNRLATFGAAELNWRKVETAAKGLSYAEIARACDDAARSAVLDEKDQVDADALVQALRERRCIHPPS